MFPLLADADGAWDDDPNLDSFGWRQEFSNSDAFNTGPVIAGKCPPGGPGTATDPQQGFGTRFGGVPGATDATGLGTDDWFWIDVDACVPGANGNGGCFFFGGCTGPAVTGTAHNPYGGYWLKVFGSDRVGAIPTCDAAPNETGSPAVLEATYTDPGVDLVLTSTPVPNTTGLFFFGPMVLTGDNSLGDGIRCVGGMTTRMLPFVTAGMMMQAPNTAQITVSYTAPYAADLIERRYFQHWFRSGLSSGTGSNVSSAVSVDF